MIGYFQAILLDLDDTLYPYEQFVLGGFRGAAQYASRVWGISESCFYERCLREWTEKGHSGKIFNRVLVELGLPESELPCLVNSFRCHRPSLKLYPDARGLLEAARGRISMGIITNGVLEVQKRKVEALNLEHYFKVVVYADEYGKEHWKPSPVPFTEAWRVLGSPPPQEVVYIGDNPYIDFIGAKKLGFQTRRLLRGPFSNVEVSPEIDADAGITSLLEVLESK